MIKRILVKPASPTTMIIPTNLSLIELSTEEISKSATPAEINSNLRLHLNNLFDKYPIPYNKTLKYKPETGDVVDINTITGTNYGNNLQIHNITIDETSEQFVYTLSDSNIKKDVQVILIHHILLNEMKMALNG